MGTGINIDTVRQTQAMGGKLCLDVEFLHPARQLEVRSGRSLGVTATLLPHHLPPTYLNTILLGLHILDQSEGSISPVRRSQWSYPTTK